MEAKDFRVGNIILYPWVNAEGKASMYKTIECVDLNGVYFGVNRTILTRVIPKNIVPIEITKEWLEKFGFKQGEDWGTGQEGLDYSLKEFNVYRWKEGWKGDNILPVEFPTQYGLKIKYVHQLQNLYFAMTGDELEIK